MLDTVGGKLGEPRIIGGVKMGSGTYDDLQTIYYGIDGKNEVYVSVISVASDNELVESIFKSIAFR
jgi:hypothetical protein